jgi:hypothetical protein
MTIAISIFYVFRICFMEDAAMFTPVQRYLPRRRRGHTTTVAIGGEGFSSLLTGARTEVSARCSSSRVSKAPPAPA